MIIRLINIKIKRYSFDRFICFNVDIENTERNIKLEIFAYINTFFAEYFSIN